MGIFGKMTSVLGTHPYTLSLAVIPSAVVMAFVPHFVKHLLLSRVMRYDNTAPRDYISQAQAKSNNTNRAIIAQAKRAEAAHLNGLEFIPIVSGCFLAAVVAQVPASLTDKVALGVIASRFVYNLFYIFGNSQAIAGLRSLSWTAGTVSCLYLGFKAATT